MICLALVCSTKAFSSFFPKSSPISFNLWSILNCKKKCTNFDQHLLYMNLEISLDDAISHHGKLGQLNDSLALLIFLSDRFSLPVKVTIFVWFQFSYLVLLLPAYTSGVTSQVVQGRLETSNKTNFVKPLMLNEEYLNQNMNNCCY